MTAVANLAAAETNPSAIAAAGGITAPALLFSGSNDCVTPPADHQVPMYEALSSDCRTRISLTGASHCQFAEQNGICSLGEGGCQNPTITRQQQHDLTLLLLTPWLDYALKDDLWAWLEFEDLLDSTTGVAYESACEPTWVAGGEDIARGDALCLSPAFPNPFADRSAVVFALTAPADVRIRIVSLAGRVIATLDEGRRAAGPHTVIWDGRDGAGCRAASGVYACEVEAAGLRRLTAMVLLR